MSEMTFTYQTRLSLDEHQYKLLAETAKLLSHVERCLYADIAKGNKASACKNSYLKRFGITARQFNACRVSIEGKVAACQETQKLVIQDLKESIKRLDKKMDRLEFRPSQKRVLFQKKCRRKRLANKLDRLMNQKKEGKVSLCFGGKKLFRAQYHIEKSRFNSKKEWKQAWQSQRDSQFFVLGSKDETAGNQTCTATLQENGKLKLRLRLPKVFESLYGKYLYLQDVEFSYGQQALLNALFDPKGRAISYRFKKDTKGWRLFASCTLPEKEKITHEGIGALGLDLNVDHIALVETDRFGNIIDKTKFIWVSYGQSQKQIKAITGDICKQIIERAIQTQKPLVIEKLDFQKKKQTLSSQKVKMARLLSSFSYQLFFTILQSRAYREGVAVHAVNPAYTSVIGIVNYARRYGLSCHHAAALCITRRYQGFSELPHSTPDRIPDGKGRYIVFDLPVRNRSKHVWSFWGQVKRKIQTVLAAHFQAIRHRSLSSTAFETASAPDCYR